MEGNILSHAIELEREVGEAVIDCSKEVISELFAFERQFRLAVILAQIGLIYVSFLNIAALLIENFGGTLSAPLQNVFSVSLLVAIFFVLTLPIAVSQKAKRSEESVPLWVILFQGLFWMPLGLSFLTSYLSDSPLLPSVAVFYLLIGTLLIMTLALIWSVRRYADNVPLTLMLTSARFERVKYANDDNAIPSQLAFAKKVVQRVVVNDEWGLEEWEQLERTISLRETGIDVQVSTVSLLLAVLAFLGLLPSLMTNGLEGLFTSIAELMSTSVGNIIPIGADTIQNIIIALLLGMTFVGVLFFNGMYKSSRVQEIMLFICREKITLLQRESEPEVENSSSRWLLIRQLIFG